MIVNKEFLPINKQDMKNRNIDQLDFIIITGDAYVDHPSFGTAIISRVLENEGFSVGIIAQPDWNSAESFKTLGKPKLGFLINSGNIDSMVNHYTASKRRDMMIFIPLVENLDTDQIGPLLYIVTELEKLIKMCQL